VYSQAVQQTIAEYARALAKIAQGKKNAAPALIREGCWRENGIYISDIEPGDAWAVDTERTRSAYAGVSCSNRGTNRSHPSVWQGAPRRKK
jgi:hypothetical protein